MKSKERETIDGLEEIISRSDLPPVVLEDRELSILEDAVVFIKRYCVLKNYRETILQ